MILRAVETICEKITRRNVLTNQFYAVLAIFLAPKRGAGKPPQIFPTAYVMVCKIWIFHIIYSFTNSTIPEINSN